MGNRFGESWCEADAHRGPDRALGRFLKRPQPIRHQSFPYSISCSVDILHGAVMFALTPCRKTSAAAAILLSGWRFPEFEALPCWRSTGWNRAPATQDFTLACKAVRLRASMLRGKADIPFPPWPVPGSRRLTA